MRVPRVLALVMAGGAGSRLEVLTEQRAKPALPFGGVYRLIDFPLSNCMHSDIDDVWIIQQYQPHSLNDYVANGRPWDLDRTYGGLRILHPHLGDEEEGFHRGNADAIWRNASLIEEHEADLVLVLSSDHVYRLDYRNVIAAHRGGQAEVTMVTTQVEAVEAARFGVVVTDEDKITNYEYKPDKPKSNLATTEVFLFDRKALLHRLDALSSAKELEDLGHDLLPAMVEDGAAREFRMDGYWRDVGTIDSYWQGHMDLLGDRSALELNDPTWLIHTSAPQRPPALIATSADTDDALFSPGSRVAGKVTRSVLGPGVVVEEGARVEQSVIFDDAVIRAGSRVAGAIIDEGVVVGAGALVGEPPTADDVDPDRIALVGRNARVDDGQRVGPSDRVDPTG